MTGNTKSKEKEMQLDDLGVLGNLVLCTAFLMAFAAPFHILDLKIPNQ